LEEKKSVRDTGLVLSVFLLGMYDFSKVAFSLGEVDVSGVLEDL
jgi:hypothetical protein